MKRWIAVLAVLGLAHLGCDTQPRMVQISGTVTSTFGGPVPSAQVIASTLDTGPRKQRRYGDVLVVAFADGVGRYRLSVPVSPDSISLTALSPVATGALHSQTSGHVAHVLATRSQTVDMVLDHVIAL